MDKAKSYNSLILMIFLYISSLTYPLNYLIGNGISVWVLTVVLLISSLWINKLKIKVTYLILTIALLILFLINILLVPYQSIVISIFIEFVKFSLLALFFVFQDLDFPALIKSWNVVAWISTIIWVIFYKHVYTGRINYMFFGITMTYSFAIFAYKFMKERKIQYLFVSLAVFSGLVIFANRGAILICVAISLFLGYKRSKAGFLGLSIIGMFLLLFDIKRILLMGMELIIKVLQGFNINSYSLNKILITLDKGVFYSSSGRDILYKESLDIISEGFLPRGVGYFQHVTSSSYPHNFFLDFFIIFGFLGIVILISLVLAIIGYYLHEKDPIRKDVFTIFLISTGIRLSLSTTFLYDSLFWVLIGLLIKSYRMLPSRNSNYG